MNVSKNIIDQLDFTYKNKNAVKQNIKILNPRLD